MHLQQFFDSPQENDQDRFQDPFQAKLCRPADSSKTRSWSFIVLPKNASAKLPSRGMRAIEGTINGFHFQGRLEPDGQKSHWLKVDRKVREAAGAKVGDVVTFSAFLAKDGSHTAAARQVTLPDGRKVFAGSAASTPEPKQEQK